MIYIKIFGGFLTFLASSMLGYCITLKSQKRVVELENLKLYIYYEGKIEKLLYMSCQNSVKSHGYSIFKGPLSLLQQHQ